MKKVVTVVDLTGESPQLKLECEACHATPERLHSKFCSTCGAELDWTDIQIRQPEPPQSTAKPRKLDAGYKENGR